MSRISVIVPTFNRKAYLLQALDAVRAQSRPVAQIIVWDDGSTDGTAAAMAHIDDPLLEYHRAENAGKSAALNQAMALAKGDYIWICDDDDLPLPTAAQHMAGVLDADSRIGIAGGCYDRFHDHADGRETTGPGYWPDLSQGMPLRHLLEDMFLFQNATMVRRKCYDRVGPFREDLPRSIDYDMIIRLAVRYPLRISDEKLFLQRKHDGDRGPLGHRHAASMVDGVWAKQDRLVFEGLHDQIPLSLMSAMFTGAPDAVRRAALLQRGAVFARHHLWSLALDDFEAAAIASPAPLDRCTTAICRRAVSGKHGVLLDSTQVQRLAALRRSSVVGRQIAGSLGRGLIWSVRRAISVHDRREALRLADLMRHSGVHWFPAAGADTLHENREIAPEAYNC